MCLAWANAFCCFLLSAVLTSFTSLGVMLAWPAHSGMPPTPIRIVWRPFLAVGTERLAARPGRGRHHLTLRDITGYRLQLCYCLRIYSSTSGQYRLSVGNLDMLDAARRSSCH